MLTTVESSGTTHARIAQPKRIAFNGFFLLLIMFLFFNSGCSKLDNITPQNNDSLDYRGGDKVKHGYEVTNLVSDVEEYNPEIIDTNLINAWGIALSPSGVFWISAADAHLSVIYNDEGETLRPPVTMDGNPTGQVFNGTTGFVIPSVGAARFIFVTEDGKITAWRTGNTATTILDNGPTGAAYTGAELANDGTGTFLYVANVAQGRVDVYDENWTLVAGKPFHDPNAPAGSPFNIRLIEGKLYVTYTGPDETGGFVNIFDTKGNFVKRFATGGPLNGPWGITNTPPDFALGQSILIGNFADGLINIYNKNGQFKGQLGDEDGNAIVIEGLWALVFKPGAFDGTGDVDLYFTAGPDDEEHGLFGEIEHIEETETGLTQASAPSK